MVAGDEGEGKGEDVVVEGLVSRIIKVLVGYIFYIYNKIASCGLFF